MEISLRKFEHRADTYFLFQKIKAIQSKQKIEGKFILLGILDFIRDLSVLFSIRLNFYSDYYLTVQISESLFIVNPRV